MMRTALRYLVAALTFILNLTLTHVLAMAATPSQAGAAGLGFMVEPVRVEMVVEPGETQMVTLAVTPAGDDSGPVDVEMTDWFTDPGGRIRFVPAGSLDRSASPWIRMAPTALQVRAGQVGEVRLTVTAPRQGAAGTYWSMLLFRGAPSLVAPERGIAVQGQVGVPVYVTVRGTERSDTRISAFEVSDVGAGMARVVLELTNHGNVVSRASGQVEVRDALGETVARLEVPQDVVLPGLTRRYQLALPRPLPGGRYVALAMLTTERQEMLVGEAFFELAGR